MDKNDLLMIVIIILAFLLMILPSSIYIITNIFLWGVGWKIPFITGCLLVIAIVVYLFMRSMQKSYEWCKE